MRPRAASRRDAAIPTGAATSCAGQEQGPTPYDGGRPGTRAEGPDDAYGDDDGAAFRLCAHLGERIAQACEAKEASVNVNYTLTSGVQYVVREDLYASYAILTLYDAHGAQRHRYRHIAFDGTEEAAMSEVKRAAHRHGYHLKQNLATVGTDG